ncbi:MAG TPA: AMP-binding protein, partial [Acidimicrobiales bacterium]|nr:AMP-binding protein [Acidimicrobiales bacterium]
MLTTALSSPTHPAAIAEAAVVEPDRVAVRFRQGDRWVAWTRREYVRAILRQARHLRALGLRPGDRVGIVGPTSPGWAVGALAAQAAGGVIVGLYPTSAPAQLEQSFRAVSARIVLVGAVA